MWKVILSQRFELWLNEQETTLQEKVFVHLGLLKTYGPALPRPYADTVNGSQFQNRKELRIQHNGKPIRTFFAFDLLRQAFVLCGGDKSNDKRFYHTMINVADAEFSAHLANLENQNENT